MRAFLRGGRCFFSSLDSKEESSSMLSKGRLRETAGSELIDVPIMVLAVWVDLRVPGGSMIRIFFKLNPSGENRKEKVSF